MERRYPEFSGEQPEELPASLPIGIWLKPPNESWIVTTGILRLETADPKAFWHYRGAMRPENDEQPYNGGTSKDWIDWSSVRKLEADAKITGPKVGRGPKVGAHYTAQEPKKSVDPRVDLKAVRAGHVNTLLAELNRPLKV